MQKDGLEIGLFLRSRLSEKRIAHSKGTALLAQSLCIRMHENPRKGFLAGLLHDIAREMERDRMRELALSDGNGIAPWEEEHPILLHGRAGAMLIEKCLWIDDPAILDAVRNHTCGRPNMGIIEQLVYVADFLEPTRKVNDGKKREALLNGELLDMMLYVTENKFRYLDQKGRKLTEPARLLYEGLKEQKKLDFQEKVR